MTQYQRKGGESRDWERTGQANKSVAVLVPCHNVASAVAQAVREFRRNLPTALVYVPVRPIADTCKSSVRITRRTRLQCSPYRAR
jgi:hypothetical protein